MEDQSSLSTVVAIDRDKSSQFAVKWTVDHLLINNPNLVLVHVRVRNVTNPGFVIATPEPGPEQTESEMQQFFLPFRGYCARKGVEAKEVVLDETDISKALVDYINTNRVSTIIVGASTRSALARKFKNDVPTSLTKSAPEFCTVYVIAKGKVATVRSANRPLPNTPTPPKQPFPIGLPPSHPDQDEAVKTPFVRGRNGVLPGRRSLEKGSQDFARTPPRERPKSVSENLLTEEYDLMSTARLPRNRDSISDDIDFTGSLRFGSVDISAENLDFRLSSESPRNSLSLSPASRDIEAEMKRLKLELKQTMDMYSSACKEAISAKQKANELHRWKVEEARRFEDARRAEEAALAIAEREKAKCRVAIEAAEAAQRLAEMEAQKRRNAEMKARKEAAEKKRALNVLANNDIRYRKYSIEEIEAATDRFSDSLKIGEGGYGPVFRATLDHTLVAIKVLRADAAQGKRQFQQEVEVLSCIRHPNMVLLLGACPEYGCLVYEYMDHGSLEDRLFRRGNTPTIPWQIRFKIAAEIATSLLFLHQTKPEPLVHRDLKPANILLDRNYVSKISDVGLARLVPPSVADSVTQYHMTSAAGTFCYIDPEYQQTGMLGIKSDIYSLGIMLLQIVTAKPPMGLSHHTARAIDKGTFAELLDHSIPDWPLEDTLSFAKLALKCAELRRKDRPDLSSVILPELNRLRNLGCNERTGFHNYGFGPRSHHSYNTSSQSSNNSNNINSSNSNNVSSNNSSSQNSNT
ncbi:hypothetical protein IFM89_002187 [Coptis chinensis]|uniref:RING-type E3 ubiquitin transferase n=1 Tax=Coptis chinensis TaxID=261450 RepID=A0A835I878_9MAGN|nr:hypothetical protein IFM89_002187 [Coptis chinensis]